MQIGKEGLTRTEEAALGKQRLLDLHNERGLLRNSCSFDCARVAPALR